MNFPLLGERSNIIYVDTALQDVPCAMLTSLVTQDWQDSLILNWQFVVALVKGSILSLSPHPSYAFDFRHFKPSFLYSVFTIIKTCFWASGQPIWMLFGVLSSRTASNYSVITSASHMKSKTVSCLSQLWKLSIIWYLKTGITFWESNLAHKESIVHLQLVLCCCIGLSSLSISVHCHEKQKIKARDVTSLIRNPDIDWRGGQLSI